MAETLEERGNLRLRLEADEDAHNPREEYDHATHVVTATASRWIDKDGGPLADAWRTLYDRHGFYRAAELFERYARIFHGAVTLEDVPLDGPNAVWYLMPDVVQREGITDPSAALADERDEYRAWARGEVYGYVVEERATWTREGTDETRETWEDVESCWGFIGYGYAEEQAREAFESIAKP